jgi:chemosensory pili system protein ChpC
MKKPRSRPRLHLLEISLEGTSLLVPSATVAEVINPQNMAPIPFSQPWLKGVIGWRTLAVPVVSYEVLLGRMAPANPSAGKIVVLYPLNGRKEWEFFGLLTNTEPRPQPADGTQPIADNSELPDSPYVAGGIKVDNRVMIVPDLDALHRVFYPA